jgi:hypothetical protein
MYHTRPAEDPDLVLGTNISQPLRKTYWVSSKLVSYRPEGPDLVLGKIFYNFSERPIVCPLLPSSSLLKTLKVSLKWVSMSASRLFSPMTSTKSLKSRVPDPSSVPQGQSTALQCIPRKEEINARILLYKVSGILNFYFSEI